MIEHRCVVKETGDEYMYMYNICGVFALQKSKADNRIVRLYIDNYYIIQTNYD